MTGKKSKAGQALLDDVLAIKAGAPTKIWTPERLLVISVRKQLKKTQADFSRLLGIPVATIRDWEQGRKQPDSAAVTLVKVAQKHPEVLEDIAESCFVPVTEKIPNSETIESLRQVRSGEGLTEYADLESLKAGHS